MSVVGSFSLSLSLSVLLSVLLFSDSPDLCLLSLLHNTRNTNINASGEVQTRNPSKRSAAISSRKPLGHREGPLNIVSVVQSRRMRWAAHVARIG